MDTTVLYFILFILFFFQLAGGWDTFRSHLRWELSQYDMTIGSVNVARPPPPSYHALTLPWVLPAPPVPWSTNPEEGGRGGGGVTDSLTEAGYHLWIYNPSPSFGPGQHLILSFPICQPYLQSTQGKSLQFNIDFIDDFFFYVKFIKIIILRGQTNFRQTVVI